MLRALHRLSAEGLSDRVHFKSRSSTSTSLRPTMFFFCHGWLVPATASEHETGLRDRTWYRVAHPEPDPGGLQRSQPPVKPTALFSLPCLQMLSISLLASFIQLLRQEMVKVTGIRYFDRCMSLVRCFWKAVVMDSSLGGNNHTLNSEIVRGGISEVLYSDLT